MFAFKFLKLRSPKNALEMTETLSCKPQKLACKTIYKIISKITSNIDGKCNSDRFKMIKLKTTHHMSSVPLMQVAFPNKKNK